MAATKNKRNKVDALRVNEAGDFYSQADVQKLESIASSLIAYGIKTYVYTARQDLNFNKCKALNVMGSFTTAEQNHSAFIGVVGAKEMAKKMRMIYNKTAVCPGDCTKCSLCQVVKSTVVFCEMH